VLELTGNYFPYPTKTSIQLGDKHLESWEAGHVNHHCNPNTKVVIEKLESGPSGYLVATKHIYSGEEITFDYLTTEVAMAEPFKCECHGKWIRGNKVVGDSEMDFSGAFESDYPDW
jgi:hypothetical protein